MRWENKFLPLFSSSSSSAKVIWQVYMKIFLTRKCCISQNTKLWKGLPYLEFSFTQDIQMIFVGQDWNRLWSFFVYVKLKTRIDLGAFAIPCIRDKFWIFNQEDTRIRTLWRWKWYLKAQNISQIVNLRAQRERAVPILLSVSHVYRVKKEEKFDKKWFVYVLNSFIFWRGEKP